MKRISVLAAAACAALLASCGSTAVQESRAETSTVQTTTEQTATTTVTAVTEDETQTEPEEIYDTSAISAAYLSGDTSGLDEFQMEIYERAVQVMEEVLTEDMTDYEKELAIHDYIVANITYDVDNLSVFETHGEHASDPYGALVEGRCICLGYTTTFQMFMDMLEIPCITIRGESIHEDEDNADHAWNMVELNGHSYYVDVTWDDPVPDEEGRPVKHSYFNVGEELMKAKHLWDEQLTPETDSVEESFIAHNLRTVSDESEIVDLADEALAKGHGDFYFEPEDKEDWALEKAEPVDGYVSAYVINPSLQNAVDKITRKHKNAKILFHRIEFEGRIIVMGYIYSNS